MMDLFLKERFSYCSSSFSDSVGVSLGEASFLFVLVETGSFVDDALVAVFSLLSIIIASVVVVVVVDEIIDDEFSWVLLIVTFSTSLEFK
jgi:hypothetical protein